MRGKPAQAEGRPAGAWATAGHALDALGPRSVPDFPMAAQRSRAQTWSLRGEGSAGGPDALGGGSWLCLTRTAHLQFLWDVSS